MSTSRSTKVLVIGGNGFIGRHTVAALRHAGVEVTIGSRFDRNGATKIRLQKLLHKDDWLPLIAPYNAVVNCVGILRQRPGETYSKIHHLAPAALAEACSTSKKRFVHVSALGLTATAKSRFLSSKYLGEQAIQASTGDWVIARLSLLDGVGGYGAAWLRGVARLPFFFAPNSAQGKIAALTVEDAGEALARLALDSSTDLKFAISREYELGGKRPTTFASYIRLLRARHTSKPALAIPVAGWLARLGAHLCDLMHFSPFSFGHWELLCTDNVPSPNRLEGLLGRPASDIGGNPVEPTADNAQKGWAWVAGASEGLGLAFAETLAERGYSLLLFARRAELLAEHAKRIQQTYDVHVRIEPMNLGSPELAEGLTPLCQHCPPEIGIYNAAFAPVGELLDRSLSDLVAVTQVNVTGPLVWCRILGEHMRDQQHGTLILMSSLAGEQGSPRISTYAASKAFITRLAEGLWAELEPDNVQVLCCCAGAISTPGLEAVSGQSAPGTLSPGTVATAALDNAHRGPVLIPGVVNRLAAVLLGRWLPRRWGIRSMQRITRSLSSSASH